MKKLKSYIKGRFIDGTGKDSLCNPATEETIAEVGGGSLDVSSLLSAAHAGGAALRTLSFAARGEILRALSKRIFAARDELIGLAIANGGNTRGDAKFDIDGASGTLAAYAELGKSMGDRTFVVDGDSVQLTRSVRFFGRHILVPREGVAVHINAFNFPAWNLAEKAACALLAGVPVISKPATATALVAGRIAELFAEESSLPQGAFSFLAGSVADLLSHLGGQDVVAFTGSAATGETVRKTAALLTHSVHVNVEADSLNAAVLGPDLDRSSEAYLLFIADLAREMTQKTGQKCTATRRVLIPDSLAEAVREDVSEKLAAIKVGNPALEEVTMGPLATRQQLDDVRAGIQRLAEETRSIFGGRGEVTPIGAEKGRGFFVSPVLLEATDSARARVVHELEVFGPVATLLPYSGDAKVAADLVRRGQGSLVSSVYSDDREFLKQMVFALAPYHGRLFLGSSKLGGHSVGPGTVLPQLVHGGPGRAGGGEELGGARGLHPYLQRTAISGDRPILDALFD